VAAASGVRAVGDRSISVRHEEQRLLRITVFSSDPIIKIPHPDVVDRIVQEAVRQVLEPLWEPTFHPSNDGFKPVRSCHTAVTEAKEHLEDGYKWVLDLDRSCGAARAQGVRPGKRFVANSIVRSRAIERMKAIADSEIRT
jgi:hypothetical protein